MRYKYHNENEVNQLAEEISNIITEDTIIVNIGTDRCLGDSLAPLVGTILKEHNINIPVYGTVDDPIHAVNLKDKILEINKIHPNAKIIAIDACFGDEDRIGEIHLSNKPVKPGKGVGKKLMDVGDYSIVGVVMKKNIDDVLSIHSVRLDFVLKMAKAISKAFIMASSNTLIHNEVAICKTI